MDENLRIKDNFEFGFGIGCYIFYLETENKIPEVFLEELKKYLNRVDNVSELKIDFPRIALKRGGSFKSIFPYPIFPHGKIEFSLYLPEKNQKELSAVPEYYKSLGTEKFKVTIYYNVYGLPVAFIKSSGLISDADFSDSVVIVREYLKNLFKDNVDIKFKIVGPSPAHLRFYVYSRKDANIKSIKYEYVEQRGYDEVNVFFNPDNINIDKAERMIFNSLAEMFGIFYLIISEKQHLLHLKMNFLNSFDSLLSSINKKGFVNNIKNYFCIPKNIQNTYIQLTKYDIYKIRLIKSIKDNTETIEKIERITGRTIAKEYVFESFNCKDDFMDSATYYNTLAFFENRFQNYSQLSTAIISAIIGALLGIFGTLFFR